MEVILTGLIYYDKVNSRYNYTFSKLKRKNLVKYHLIKGGEIMKEKLNFLSKTIICLVFIVFFSINVKANETNVEMDSIKYVTPLTEDDATIDDLSFYPLVNKKDKLELLIVSYYYLYSNDMNNWDESTNIDTIIPLYNEEDKIIAYYLYLTNNQYIVINNNKTNPAAIEFGEGRKEIIENIEKSGGKLLYIDPFNIYNLCETNTSTFEKTYEENYPDILEKNSILINELEQLKFDTYHENMSKDSFENSDSNILLKQETSNISLNSNNDYGFIKWKNMKPGVKAYDNCPIKGISWVTTGGASKSYNSKAKNHCGAVCLTNIALYYNKMGYNKLVINGTKKDTFNKIYEIVGPGPIFNLTKYAQKYFLNRGYTLKSGSIRTTYQYKNAIRKNRPVAMFLTESVLKSHWVLGVGWREYAGGEFFMRIVDGWYDNNAEVFYKPHHDSVWMYSSEYYL